MTAAVPARARRVRAAALLVALFAAGALTGAAAHRALDQRPRAGVRVGARIASDVPAALDALGLTADQRRRVAEVLARSQPRTEAVMREVLPRLRAVADSIDAEVRTILTPEQRARLDAARRDEPRVILRRKRKGPGGAERIEAETLSAPRAPSRP